ncbi:MAG: glycoside hydrolase family 127 protein [Phycisphaerae bacterium]|nr:glycoside hydrolase family 127 protein [Phycisphaerae bacterium]NUQ45131.1 glycoside hydrolase family 127 protein [Phycisphaerae bacterium]
MALRPVPLSCVRLHDAFWAPRIETVRSVTLPHGLAMCEQTGRLANFDRAAGRLPGGHEGRFYDDSDVFKLLEGAANLLALRPDARLDALLDDLIDRIAAAQRPDGYLNTWFTLTGLPRWADIRNKHELYCIGHLLEAAIAHRQATGKQSLWCVARRAIDHVGAVFGPGRRSDPPGHPEIELALLRAYCAFGDSRDLALARFFVEQRGRCEGRESYGEYAQDHRPIRDQHEPAGHCVRAMYLYSAVTDLAALDPAAEFDDVLERLWQDVTQRHMYVTGGLGSVHTSEGFGPPFDLPNEGAYAETCAAIGLVLWARRMQLLRRDAACADVLERALYNGVLAGLSREGDAFFYVNPLAAGPEHRRRRWFECACCPTNLARFVPSVGGLFYSCGDDEVYVDLYAAGAATLSLPNGAAVRVVQQTEYPWDGLVRVAIDCSTPTQLALHLRVPGWCDANEATLDGRLIGAERLERGYVVVRREWRSGDAVELNLPMPVRRVEADARVAACRGQVALQRGPIVYCIEGCDHGGAVDGVALAEDDALITAFDAAMNAVALTANRENHRNREREREACSSDPNRDREGAAEDDTVAREPHVARRVGVHSNAGSAPSMEVTAALPDGRGSVQQADPDRERPIDRAFPYFAWANRTPGDMRVWIPRCGAAT